MKVLVAPDSFKGTLSAMEAADAIAAGVRDTWPDAEIISMPLADGGEGTVDTMVRASGGRKVARAVLGPLGASVVASYGLLGAPRDPNRRKGVVEVAAACGLTLVPKNQRNPRHTTSYGVGELIRAAASEGVVELIVGLGGSATNDGGMGMLQALGVRFFDAQSRQIPSPATGDSVHGVAFIDNTGLDPSLRRIAFVAASDVTNPLTGPSGATAIYGPQKGADAQTVAVLDADMARFAAAIRRDIGSDVEMLPGAGAAGGIGAALSAFLGAKLTSGIDVVLQAVGWDDHVRGADLVITGEGSIDAQTLAGKAVMGIVRRACDAGVPVVALGGRVEADSARRLMALGLKMARSLTQDGAGLPEVLADPARHLRHAAAACTAAL